MKLLSTPSTCAPRLSWRPKEDVAMRGHGLEVEVVPVKEMWILKLFSPQRSIQTVKTCGYSCILCMKEWVASSMSPDSS